MRSGGSWDKPKGRREAERWDPAVTSLLFSSPRQSTSSRHAGPCETPLFKASGRGGGDVGVVEGSRQPQGLRVLKQSDCQQSPSAESVFQVSRTTFALSWGAGLLFQHLPSQMSSLGCLSPQTLLFPVLPCPSLNLPFSILCLPIQLFSVRGGSLSVRHTSSPGRAFSDAAVFGRWSKENLAALWSDS